MTKLVVGCGYLGRRVARHWRDGGNRVYAVTRSEARATEFKAEGFLPIVADLVDPDSLESLPEVKTVLHSVGYDRRAPVSRHAVLVNGLRNLLDALPSAVERILFTSSTGVMGNHGGVVVDETAACVPVREAARVALEAEQLLQAHPLGERTVILRLAGLYGPGRLPKVADLRAGRPVAAPDGAYLNLIHVEDAARVVLAAEGATAPELLLVSDGQPVGHRTFYREMARQLGLGLPEFTDPEPGSRGAAAALGNKRIDNRRMRERLGVRLEFPSYRHGLEAICSDPNA